MADIAQSDLKGYKVSYFLQMHIKIDLILGCIFGTYRMVESRLGHPPCIPPFGWIVHHTENKVHLVIDAFSAWIRIFSGG